MNHELFLQRMETSVTQTSDCVPVQMSKSPCAPDLEVECTLSFQARSRVVNQA